MSKQLTQDDVKDHKRKAISKLDNLLRKYIFSNDEKQLKKANLISYWIENFSDYVNYEDQFDPTRIINYSRGDVVRLNFGFNIGKEFGGLHYAVVLDNDSKHRSEVITVVPLSSTEGKKVHRNSVDLGSELYEKVSVMQKNLREDAEKELEKIKQMTNTVETALSEYESNKEEIHKADKDGIVVDLISKIIASRSGMHEALQEATDRLNKIKTNDSEVAQMKIGSMAVTNQITTVSKQRIYTPKRKEDFLYGVSLSTSAMEKINNKLKELYIFE